MIFRVFWNIRGKRAAIPTMSRARQLQYQVRNIFMRTRVDESWRELTGAGGGGRRKLSRLEFIVDEDWRGLTRIDVGWRLVSVRCWGLTGRDEDWREITRVDEGWRGLTRIDESWCGLTRVDGVDERLPLMRVDESWRGMTEVYESSCRGLTRVSESCRSEQEYEGWWDLTGIDQSSRDLTRDVKDWRKVTRIDVSGRKVKPHLKEMVLLMIAAPIDSMTLRAVVQIVPL